MYDNSVTLRCALIEAQKKAEKETKECHDCWVTGSIRTHEENIPRKDMP
jgi:hypothetical protein